MPDNAQPLACRYQTFAGSNNDITLQTPLWRYMTFEKFCWLVETSTLYHTRLDQFGDVFEGAVTNEYARIRDLGEVEPYFGSKDHEPWMFRALRFRQYATCWHASQYESDAQWQLYASGGAGIAVVSTMARIQKAVQLKPGLRGILGQVEYADFETHSMIRRSSGTVIRPGHLKRKSFEHEREVRGLILKELIVDGASFTMDETMLERQRLQQPLGVSAKVGLEQLIEAIVISPIAKPFVEELMHAMAERRGLKGLVRKSELLKTPAF